MENKKRGKQSFALPQMPVITAWTSVAGKKESEGPLGHSFDITSQDTYFGQKTWEQAEKQMQKLALENLLKKAELPKNQVDLVFSGDLCSLGLIISASTSLKKFLFAAEVRSLPATY